MARKYIYGPGIDRPVAMIDVSGVSETWYYYYADALGSIRLMSDAGGAIVESVAYDVFGRPRVMTGAGADGNWLTEDAATYNYSSIGNPYLFTGRRWDSVAGLYYYRFRDYSPDLGRFLQPDPLGTIDGMNLYAYVNNNPLNWLDPWGLCKQGTEQVTAEFPIGVDPLLEEMYKNPQDWEPLGPGVRESGRGKTKESYKQEFENVKTGERRGIHDKNPRGGKSQHPHTYPVHTPIFLWIVPRILIDAAFPTAPGSIFNPDRQGPIC